MKKSMHVIRHKRTIWTTESVVYALVAAATTLTLLGAVLGWY